ncbi:MAG: hypothetical protein Q9167_003565 [Letrouitia subvulpina]
MLCAAVFAQDKPNPFTVPSTYMATAGQPSTVTWQPTTPGTVTIRLRSGASSDLENGVVIGSHIDNNGKYTFTLPPSTVRNSDYTLEIVSDTNPDMVNFSAPFVVESKNTVESAPAASSAAAATTGSPTNTRNTRSKNTSTRRAMSTMTDATAEATTTAEPTDSSSPNPSGTAGAASGTEETTSAPTNGASLMLGDFKVQGGLMAMAVGAIMI